MSDEDRNSRQYPLGEPSVLDYFKSLFRFGNGEHVQIPKDEKNLIQEHVEEKSPSLFEAPESQPAVAVQPEPAFSEPTVEPQPGPEEAEPIPQRPFPWRSLLAFLLALIAQKTFEPPHTSTEFGLALYIGAFSLLGWALYHGEWKLPSPPSPLPLGEGPRSGGEGTDPLTYRGIPLVIGLALGLIGFYILGNNLFTKLNVTVWILSVVFLLWAFWLPRRSLRSRFGSITSFFQRDSWTIHLTRWSVLLIAATALIFFFRFYETTSVPPEPFSDQAEKILDVYDVSQGQTHIFFPRNTGREGFQMYWTLLIDKIFGTGLSFLSLKLGTAILGFLTLPFIYLLGKEIGGPRVGFFAFFLVGVGYWPNVISRIGLRFPLYPLFVAPTLLYLIRGFRTRNRNDFLLSGLFLGIGLHGYSPMRIVPFVVVAAFVIYWLHSLRSPRSQSKSALSDLPIWLVMLALVSLFVFMPLLRYWFDNPAIFGFRALTRLGSVEQPLPGPAYQIFFSNLWKGLAMFNYDDGEIWVNSIPHRPALGVISAALFLIGVVLVLIRYLRYRNWLDAFLLVSIPLLQLPSTLSLAFPGENPALNRAGAAYIPAFILAALALDGLLTSFGGGRSRSALTFVLAGGLLFLSASQNYNLVFNEFYTSFRQGAWNSSDMGKVIKEFEQTYGTTDTVWIVPFPYWVDTRLPAVWAGIPNRDMAMWRENLPNTVEIPGPKLFLLKADVEHPEGNDQESLDVLKSLYPSGQLRRFDSDVPGHDFWIFTVPND